MALPRCSFYRPQEQTLCNHGSDLGDVETSEAQNDTNARPQVHDRMSECLMAERERFMKLLGKHRQDRMHREAFACSLIQSAYRGYLLRKRWVGEGGFGHIRF